MDRRNFIKGIPVVGSAGLWSFPVEEQPRAAQESPRSYWLTMLHKVSEPVLRAQSENRLEADMPVEAAKGQHEARKQVSHLEAVGRTLAGLAPWLELPETSPSERQSQQKFRRLSLESITNAVDRKSQGYLNFKEGTQPLVDAAFLAHALIRAPRALWEGLDPAAKTNVVSALRDTRVIKPYYSNWLLFTAMVEAALLKFSGDYDPVRVDYAIKEHLAWYKGDGVYGDGPDFHFDYYNSYVIHPMLADITRTVYEKTGSMEKELALFEQRARRYAEIQERMISPEGTFPPVGRSLAYRCGAFQLLAQVALQKKLPESLLPAQVRGALTAAIKKTLDVEGTFDSNGWLTIGLSGHQPSIGETYISTGSLYLCTTAFLPLGLPASDVFWSAPDADWTSKRAFSGKDIASDKASS